ncbi:hypothetical protein D3C86_1727270 [compost metagenome]
MPAEVIRNESAKARTNHHTQQAEYGNKVHGLQKPALGVLVQYGKTRYRHHHRGANRLKHPRKVKRKQVNRECTAQRSGNKQPNGNPKHGSCAKLIGQPARKRNKQRQRQGISNDDRMHLCRRVLHVARYDRQRRI